MKMDASVMVKLTAMINNGSISVKIQQYSTIVMDQMIVSVYQYLLPNSEL